MTANHSSHTSHSRHATPKPAEALPDRKIDLGYLALGLDQPWVPALHLNEVGGRWRLSLVGCTCGDGHTFQERGQATIRNSTSARRLGHPTVTPTVRETHRLWRDTGRLLATMQIESLV